MLDGASPLDLAGAIRRGSAAEKELKDFLAFIEGPRTRFIASGVGKKE
jgi:hypothetical protein